MMHKPNKLLLSTALLAFSMMSGGIFNLAFAQTNTGYEIDAEIPEEEEDDGSQNGSHGAEWEDDGNVYYYSDSSNPGFSVDDENPTGDLSDSLAGEVTTDYNSTSTGSTQGETATLEEAVHTYPSFSDEEITSLFNVTDVASDENSLQVEPIEGVEEGDLHYLDEGVSRYRPLLPPDPVYIYGKDKNGAGTCAGTADFCQKSSELYATYLKQIEVGEHLTITDKDDENFGNLVQPDSYQKSADKYMPNVDEGSCQCPSGYDVQPDGHNGVEGEHCGRTWGANDNRYNWQRCR